MISLPRVKFLEDDGPYRPKWAIDYTPKESAEVLETNQVRNLSRYRSGRDISTEITELEQQLADFIAQGLSVNDIHDKTKRTRSTIVSTLNRYKRKIALKKEKDGV
jgi:DNA-binding NarL/FixJ family response regulator